MHVQNVVPMYMQQNMCTGKACMVMRLDHHENWVHVLLKSKAFLSKIYVFVGLIVCSYKMKKKNAMCATNTLPHT